MGMDQKIKSLQGLRGWAILMIVLWHLKPLFPGSLPKLGDRGVEFFLLLSGFLIARRCDSSDALSSFKGSAAYAFRKLKGAYWLYLIPAVPVFLLDAFASQVSLPFWRLLSYCTLTQSWVPDSRIYWGVNSAGWFLPAILFCYLMTPAIRKVVCRFGAGPVLSACLLLQVAAELLAKRYLGEMACDWLLYICPAIRVLDFMLGFCAWSLFRSPGRKFSPRAWNALYAVILLVLAGLMWLRPTLLGYVLYHPFDIALLLIVASEKSVLANALNRNPAVMYLGNLSRIIFLTHVPVIRLTGIIWRRILSPDLLFPLWLVSLLMILLTAVAISRFSLYFQRRK